MLDFSNSKILIVGDVMLDKYYYGEVTRISPEAPVPITRVTNQKETLGGAANVAANLAHLECQVFMGGVTGDDENRLPVYFEAPIRVGVASGRLTGWSNLKYPFDSRIK